RTLANVWTSSFFGNAMSPEEYREVVRHLQGEATSLSAAQLVPFLHHAAVMDNDYFHWELAFPEIFFDEYGRSLGDRAGFDAVIGNPPYVDIKGLVKVYSDFLTQRFEESVMRINIFAAFIEQAMGLGKESTGKISLIVPTSFLTLVSYSKLRKRLLEECTLHNVVRLPNEIFGDFAGEVKVDTCIFVASTCVASVRSNTLIMIYESFERIDEITIDTAHHVYEVETSIWFGTPEQIISLSDPVQVRLWHKLEAEYQVLEDLCEFCLGLTPYDKYQGHTPKQISEKAFHANFQKDNTYKPLLLSGDVSRYEIIWNEKDWISYGTWLAAPREQKFFTEPRILVQQIIDWSTLRIWAGYTDEELYNTQNQFNLLAKPGVNIFYILGVINSRLMSFYHRSRFLDISVQRFQKILIKDAKRFPVPFVTQGSLSEDEQDFTMLALKLSQNVDDRFLQQAIALLAKTMVEMKKDRLKLVQRFWLDLEGVAGDGLAKLQKGKWEESLHKGVAAARPFVRADSRSTRTLEESLGWNEAAFRGFVRLLLGKVRGLADMVAVYNSYHVEYAALVQRIAETDGLIDQIVYRLYGLTEEEIAIVEGSG
ncbi:MAG: Eco57I restriction-modification methylase domain-containing protein, partial [Anaerolineales bacterium]|nr:Eco57I restriction-modification methylase domain-containing protein [Anaerolineales bacterium]